jgi:DNA polymerase-1
MPGYVTGLDAHPCGADCESCPLKLEPWVPGYGPEQADVVIIGEAPGANEVSRGRPFVGKSGELLDKVLKELGVDRSKIYITNSVMCRPPDNRTPSTGEIKACNDRLLQEVAARKPRLIIPMGAVPYKALLGGKSIKADHGKLFKAKLNDQEVWVVPTYHPAAALRFSKFYPDIVRDVQYGFDLLAGKVSPQEHDVGFSVVENPQHLKFLLENYSPPPWEKQHVTVDVENASDGRLLCIGLSFYPYKKAIVVPEELVDDTTIKQLLTNTFTTYTVVGHNLKYDARKLWTNGISCNIDHDTMLVHYSIDERKGTHGLKELAVVFLKVPSWNDTTDTFITHMEDCPRDEMYEYNAHDVIYTGLLFERLYPMQDDDDRRVYNEKLIPGSRALARMEHRGVLVNPERLHDVAVHLAGERYADGELGGLIGSIRNDMFAMIGHEFNPNSPMQLSQIIYKELGLPMIPEYADSTGKKAMERLEEWHDFPAKLLEYRQYAKLYDTYVVSIREKLDEHNVLRGNFNIHGTETGRLSSSNPNLQNIPSRGENGKVIKKLFIPRPGATWIEADFSQAEVRCLAYYSQDPVLIEMLNMGIDMHTATASILFGKKPEDVTKDERQIGKTINFAVIYRAGENRVAKTAKVSKEVAREAIAAWRQRFKVAAEWMDQTMADALKFGFVSTPEGRKRRFHLITGENKHEVMRQAVNTPIQSLASDITLSALIKLDEVLEGWKSQLLLTIHDANYAETWWHDPREVANLVRSTMIEQAQTVCPGIPFKVDVKMGTSWGETEEVAA